MKLHFSRMGSMSVNCSQCGQCYNIGDLVNTVCDLCTKGKMSATIEPVVHFAPTARTPTFFAKMAQVYGWDEVGQ